MHKQNNVHRLLKLSALILVIMVNICTCVNMSGEVLAQYNDTLPTYYDPKSRFPFRMTSIENNMVEPYAKTRRILKRIGFRSNGCSCNDLTCGCCLGFNIQQFNFNREGCMNFTYNPDLFAINMNMLMNGESVYNNEFSAKNPPPLCLPLPIPYLPLSVEACAKLYDIYTPGQNLHMCFNFETKIEKATILVLHFNCMKMGTDGVNFSRPGETGPAETFPSSTTESQVNPDVFDEVTEIKYVNKKNNN